MLTTDDIKNLIKAEKEVFPTKQDFEDLKKGFRSLQTSVDGIVASNKKFDQERLAQTHRIEKLETWAKPVGEKLKMPLAQ